MIGQVQASIPAFVFAAIVAVLFFGVFANRAFMRKVLSRWRNIHLRPFEVYVAPPRPEPAPPARDRAVPLLHQATSRNPGIAPSR